MTTEIDKKMSNKYKYLITTKMLANVQEASSIKDVERKIRQLKKRYKQINVYKKVDTFK